MKLYAEFRAMFCSVLQCLDDCLYADEYAVYADGYAVYADLHIRLHKYNYHQFVAIRVCKYWLHVSRCLAAGGQPSRAELPVLYYTTVSHQYCILV